MESTASKHPSCNLSSFLIDSILSSASSLRPSASFYANVSRHSETPQVMDLRVAHHQQTSSSITTTTTANIYQQHFSTEHQPLKAPPPPPPPPRQERRRNRTMFNDWQLANLEWRFARNKYLTTNDRLRIAKTLRLDQMQVKTWFQNRRMKWKKQILASGIQKSPTKPKGRPRRDSIPPIEDGLLPVLACQID